MHRTFLMFPSKSIQTDGVRAGVMVWSFFLLPTKPALTQYASPHSVSVKLVEQLLSFTLATSSEL